jgi:hypothetical protein
MALRELSVRLGALRAADDLVPVAALQDLLLDIRNELPSDAHAPLVDRLLASTARRSWFTPDEASPVLQDLSGLLATFAA